MRDPREIGTLAEEAIGDDTARFAGMSPEQRLDLFLELCELSDAIVRLFLTSEGSKRTTGEALNVSGGSVMH